MNTNNHSLTVQQKKKILIALQKQISIQHAHGENPEVHQIQEEVLPLCVPVNGQVVRLQEMNSFQQTSNSSSSVSEGHNSLSRPQSVQSHQSQAQGQKAIKEHQFMVKSKQSGPIQIKQVTNLHSVQDNAQLPIREISSSSDESMITCLKQIGDGHQSKIYTANLEDTHKMKNQCIKVFEPYKDLESEMSAQCEFRVAQSLKGHPNIVQINNFYKNQTINIDGKPVNKDFMVMDYCKNGDMYDFMTLYTENQPKSFKGLYLKDKALLKSMYVQLVDGLHALHTQGNVAHMDLKLENLLVSEDGTLKLCDFGFCHYSQTPVNKMIGTPFYMAPEIFGANKASCDGKVADFYSLGVLFFILAFGVPPFHQATMQDTYFKFLKLKPGSTDFFKFHPHTRQQYKQLDPNLMQLLLKLMSAEPNTRIQSTKDLLQDPFLAGNSLSLGEAGSQLLSIIEKSKSNSNANKI